MPTCPYLISRLTRSAPPAQSVRKLAHRLSMLPPESATRRKHEKLLLDKLYDMGLLSSKASLSQVEHGATVSAFARRRLPVVMTRLRMAQTLQAAIKYVEQGHVRVGTETVTDPVSGVNPRVT